MYRIGIDLGGTNIAVGVVDDRHRFVAEASLPAGAHRPAEQVVADMCRAVELALDKAGLTPADCASIGVGAPGTCDPERGVVVRAYNLNWFDVPVCAMLTAHFGLPARLSNDANCAALAETVAGAAVGCRNMMLITLGTGVGGGIIVDGRIVSGLGGAGGEPGHSLLVLDGEPCTCGRRGCWEVYASATALIRQGREAAAAHHIPAEPVPRADGPGCVRRRRRRRRGGAGRAGAVLCLCSRRDHRSGEHPVAGDGAHRRRHQPAGRASAASHPPLCGRQLLWR